MDGFVGATELSPRQIAAPLITVFQLDRGRCLLWRRRRLRWVTRTETAFSKDMCSADMGVACQNLMKRSPALINPLLSEEEVKKGSRRETGEREDL